MTYFLPHLEKTTNTKYIKQNKINKKIAAYMANKQKDHQIYIIYVRKEGR